MSAFPPDSNGDFGRSLFPQNRWGPPKSFFDDFFDWSRPFEFRPPDLFPTSMRMRMDEIMKGFDTSPFRSPPYWSPCVDISLTSEAFTVTAKLEGVKKDDIKVEIEAGYLKIEAGGHKESCRDDKGWKIYECSCGKFMHSVRLPNNAKIEKVSAKFIGGNVLKVTIPLV
ncbi:hypothetical protein EV182_000643 [Spiromyces aspiralis]|uniref:Uncharacterized protein n=1 Tax=Spiromyces aspiralis TaxID=68401 RepID=A0ACC1HGL5_9FUNG|nr:hypothetical protein EV182_000643 [Spiromyces aspiralis]